MKIKSKPDAIEYLLAKVIDELPVAAKLYRKALESPKKKRPEMLVEMHEIETKADENYLKYLDKVGESFITPYDREDLFAMAEACDDFIDNLDHGLDLIVRFDIDEPPAAFIAGARSLENMALKCQDAVEIIKKPKKLRTRWLEISAIENEMDVRYNEIITDLYGGDYPVFDALRLKNVADAMEKSSDTLEEFARVLARTSIKE